MLLLLSVVVMGPSARYYLKPGKHTKIELNQFLKKISRNLHGMQYNRVHKHIFRTNSGT